MTNAMLYHTIPFSKRGKIYQMSRSIERIVKKDQACLSWRKVEKEKNRSKKFDISFETRASLV